MKLCSKLPLNHHLTTKKSQKFQFLVIVKNRRLCYTICYFQRVINVFSYCFDVFSIRKPAGFVL